MEPIRPGNSERHLPRANWRAIGKRAGEAALYGLIMCNPNGAQVLAAFQQAKLETAAAAQLDAEFLAVERCLGDVGSSILFAENGL